MWFLFPKMKEECLEMQVQYIEKKKNKKKANKKTPNQIQNQTKKKRGSWGKWESCA